MNSKSYERSMFGKKYIKIIFRIKKYVTCVASINVSTSKDRSQKVVCRLRVRLWQRGGLEPAKHKFKHRKASLL